MAISCMHSASGDNYRHSLFILDEAMGQIPCSTECISSYLMISEFVHFFFNMHLSFSRITILKAQ